jgi:hypothetical protein
VAGDYSSNGARKVHTLATALGAATGAGAAALATATGAAPTTTPVAKERAMLNSSRARLYSGTAVMVYSNVKSKCPLREMQKILFVALVKVK